MNFFVFAQTKEDMPKVFEEMYDEMGEFLSDENKVKYFDEAIIKKVISIYHKHARRVEEIKGHEKHKFLYYKIRGTQLQWIGLTEESNKNLKKAWQLFSVIKDSVSDLGILQMHWGLKEMARNYVNLNQLDSATIFYKKNIQYSQKYYSTEKVAIASTLNNLGIHFTENLKQRDSGLYYFKKAELLQLLDVILINKSFLGSIRDNIANIYVKQGKLQEAKIIFQKNYEFYQPENYPLSPDYERWARAGIQLAEIHLRLNQPVHSKQILNEVSKILFDNDFLGKEKLQVRYLRATKDIYQIQKEYKKAYEVTGQMQQLQDSLTKAEKERQVLWNYNMRDISLRYMKENAETRELLKRAAQEKKIYTLWITIAFLMLLGSILLYYLVRYRQRTLLTEKKEYLDRQELQVLQYQKELMEDQMELQKNNLYNFREKFHKNQEWSDQVFHDIQQIKKTEGKARTKLINELKEKIDKTIIQDQKDKNSIEKEFHEKLLNSYPRLTKTEVKLCTLIRLGVENHEIAELLNVHTDSVLQNKYRLKKKLNLTKEENLNIFLKKV